jgi:hypothetical protein
MTIQSDYSISTSELARLALDDKLNLIKTDPRNARYLVPLDDPHKEEDAHFMADAMFFPNSNGPQTFEECPANARRMLCDLEYARLFGLDEKDIL